MQRKNKQKKPNNMKKVLFMFVAVLALVSCQKGAEKSSEVSNDSTKTEAVEKKAAEATELVAPEKTGDIAEDLIAQAKFVLAKIKACKTAEELSVIEEDQSWKDFDALMKKAEQEATPEQKQKLTEFFQDPANDFEEAMQAKLKEIM